MSAVARNLTPVPIVVRLACPAGGLAVRVLDAAGTYRVPAAYESADARSPVAEWPLVVR